MKYFLIIILFSLNSLAFVSLKDMKDTADEAAAAAYTIDAFQELLEEIELGEVNRKARLEEVKQSIDALRNDLDEIGYTEDEIKFIMGPLYGGSNLEFRIRALTRRIRAIKSLYKKVLSVFAGKATTQAVIQNETNKILRDIEYDESMERIDRENMIASEIRLKIMKEKKRKIALNKNIKSISEDSKKRKMPEFLPFHLKEENKETL